MLCSMVNWLHSTIDNNFLKPGQRVQKRRILDKPDRMKDGHEKNAKKSIKNYEPLSREELDAYKEKFAQRMRENIIEFEKFCSTYIATKRK